MGALERLQELLTVNRALVSTLDYERVLRLVVEKTAAFTSADSCVLLLRDADGQVRVAAAVGANAEQLSAFKNPFDERIDVTLRERLGFSTRDTFLGVPVIYQGRITGLLAVYRQGELEPDPEEQCLVTALADQAAIALEHASRYEEVSLQSERKSRLLETIQSNTATALAYLDPRLRFLEANAAYCIAVGLSRDALIGRRHCDLFPDTEIFRRMQKLVSDYRPVEISEIPLQVSGEPSAKSTFWDWSARPVLDASHALEGVVISAIDVTQKVNARLEIEAEARRKDEFLAMLAHELRNPLSALSSAVEVLNIRLPQDDSLAQATQIARRQLRHMSRLLDDLLDVSRISHGKITLRAERVDLGDIVNEAVQSLAPLLESMNHRLEVTRPAERIVIRGDPNRLVQIVSNLLTNAAKYTPRQGHIQLTLSRLGAEAEVRVRDDGIGIPADLLPRVFDLFSQSQQGLDRTQGGLGIGLTLVKRLTEMHGGHVQAYSKGLDQGSEFVVALPVCSDPEKHPAVAETPQFIRSSSLQILLVEDNPDNADTLATLLELEGHRVLLAADGMAALKLARQHLFDVVLLDIGLPGLDGYEVARRLRSEHGRAPRIIALSGYGEDTHRSRADGAGIHQFLLKPVSLDQLRRALAPDASERVDRMGQHAP